MRCAVVVDGVVVNIIIAEEPDEFGAVPCNDDTWIGDIWDGESFHRPPDPELGSQAD